MNEDEMVAEFAEKVHEIIKLRKQEDDYLRGKTPVSSAHTYGAEVQADNHTKIVSLTKDANLLLVMLDDIVDSKPVGFIARMKRVLADLKED